MCGEQLPPALVLFFVKGSPPRVRGTGTTSTNTSILIRITPACAGNSIRLAYCIFRA